MIILYACIETEPVSPVPEIEFISFDLSAGYDNLGNDILLGKLKFSFIDGDADFGINIDTTKPQEYNIFLSEYGKLNDTYYFIEPDTTTPPLNYTVQHDDRLDRVGQNTTIRGTVTLNIYYLFLPDYDTIRYDFYIVDRAGHESNIESTTDISFTGFDLPEY